jgi:hypothetical protein
MEQSISDLSGPASQIKSKERVSAHGEVFTADREVNAMLDLVKQETERVDSRFLEPACGNGNFLVRILERKLAVVRRMYQPMGRSAFELNALIALGSLYGIELQMDNVLECRQRLFDIFRQTYAELFPDLSQSDDFLRSAQYMLERNILWGDALTLRTPDESAAIVFSEWSAINQQFKRRDFTLDALLKNTPMEGPNIFSDLGDEAFIPKPIAEFPLIHYTKIYTHGTPELQS